MDSSQKEKITLALSFIAYKGLEYSDPVAIARQIDDALEFIEPYIGKYEIVWGPADHKDGLEVFTDSLMFIVRNKEYPSEYTVVIRGTSPLSLATYIYQDYWINDLCYWDSGNPPVNAKISHGVYLGLHILQQLKPISKVPGNNKRILDFLKNIVNNSTEKITINITGHSLGGALAPTFALWLYDKSNFIWPERKPDIYTYAYAGFSAGNKLFAHYSNKIMKDKCFRYNNHLDVATYFFNKRSLGKIPLLYAPHNHMDIFVWIYYKWIYHKAIGRGYMQIETSIKIGSKVDKSKWLYWSQLGYQHTAAYLKRFVDIVNEEKKQAGDDNLLDLEYLIKELNLEGITSDFCRNHIRFILKKIRRKFISCIKKIFKKL